MAGESNMDMVPIALLTAIMYIIMHIIMHNEKVLDNGTPQADAGTWGGIRIQDLPKKLEGML